MADILWVVQIHLLKLMINAWWELGACVWGKTLYIQPYGGKPSYIIHNNNVSWLVYHRIPTSSLLLRNHHGGQPSEDIRPYFYINPTSSRI